MKIKLSENIKKFRKERKMTQEQLAEAMGVSISAVYKWESNQSVPDITLILEMAELFQTSTDVLLGYEWKNNNAESALEHISLVSEQYSVTVLLSTVSVFVMMRESFSLKKSSQRCLYAES